MSLLAITVCSVHMMFSSLMIHSIIHTQILTVFIPSMFRC